jgi:hypothetical protein
VLLAMQKVVGSNPISRFEKCLQIAGFLGSRVGKGVCVACQGFAKRGGARHVLV